MNYKKKYLEYKLKYLTAKKIVNEKKKTFKGGNLSNYMTAMKAMMKKMTLIE